jgi:hypothetical protein
MAPNSPDLTPTDFYLFSRLKSALEERRCFDATDIIKNATEEQKRLSGIFSTPSSCGQTFVFAQGEYFPGNVA